jgi:hypothetical protein
MGTGARTCMSTRSSNHWKDTSRNVGMADMDEEEIMSVGSWGATGYSD